MEKQPGYREYWYRSSSSSKTSAANKRIQVSLGMEYVERPKVDVGYVEPTLFSFAHEIFQEGPSSTIYLGPMSAASERARDALLKAGIVGIVNCTRRVPCYHRSPSTCIKYCEVPIYDEAGAPIHIYLEGATTFMRAMLMEQRGSVLVHCEQGMSRSATVVIAYLMQFHGMTLNEAYIHCKTKRPIVNPNAGFWSQLQDYEAILSKRRQQQQQQAIFVTAQIQSDNSHVDDESSSCHEKTLVCLEEGWPLKSSSMFATCREIPEVMNQEPIWQSVTRIQSQEQVSNLLFQCLDFLWGRGVLNIEIDWLVHVCKQIPPKFIPHQQIINMIKDPESDFSQTWSGEIYPEDTKRVIGAMANLTNDKKETIEG